MADQKCPMCGKLNPPELDVCQFCQARLKPLIVNQPDESLPAASAPGSDASEGTAAGTPDWLRSLRDRQGGPEGVPDNESLENWSEHEEDESPGIPFGEESVVPNWLDNLRGPTASDDDTLKEADQDEQKDDDDLLAWPNPTPDSDEESFTPDWLSGIRSEPEFSDQESEGLMEDSGSESPDWLARIRSRQQEEAPAEEPEPEQTQGVPDWLRSDDLPPADTMADQSSSAEDRAGEPSLDWESLQPVADAQEKDNVSEDSERLSWIKQGEEVPSNAPDESLDWMEDDDAATSSVDEFPDWLETGEGLTDGQVAEPDSSHPEQQYSVDQESTTGEDIDWSAGQAEAVPAEEAPDWLQTTAESGTPGVDAPLAGDVPPEPQTGAQEESSDRLQQSAQEQSDSIDDGVPGELPQSQEEAAPDGEFPDWLQSEDESPTGPEGEIPDWLSDVSVDEERSEETQPASLSEDLPDWLSDLDREVEEDVAEATNEQAATAESSEKISEWLSGGDPDLAEELEEEAEQETAPVAALFDVLDDESGAPVDEDAFEDEVPDWLMGVDVDEVGLEPVTDKPGSPKEAGLAPADLPVWLEAMRPVETEAAPEILDERDRLVVSAGPLIGLSGVLPAEPEISKVQKPPTYSVKLQVSDMQQERAAMLQELIQAEGQSRPIPKRPLVSSQNVLRMAFGLILLVAVLWPLVASGPVAPIPVFSPEIGAADRLIGQLNGQDPVLVAIDYQPGLSGEMDAIASTLIDHMMLRGAYLTLVSTTASGPIQAEHVVEISNRQFSHSYLGAGEYTNLGYIPGGPTGLISFAANPRAMMAYALDDGRPAWENSPLQNVQNLSDFALVTVVTENPETARAWIEQVQPLLGDKPLIMGISAQAEPMVRPYYEAYPKQVQGMVVGLAGSAAYESLLGHPGLSYDYWNSFGIGLLAAIILIFVGGLFNMFPIFLKGGRENSSEREEHR